MTNPAQGADPEPIISEMRAKFDSVAFSVDYLKNQNLYSEDHIKIIEEQVQQIQAFLHSKKCDHIQSITASVIPALSRNLQRHNFVQLLSPYEALFNDYVIKIRSFPSSILNEDDSETILAFYHQLKSLLVYLESRKNIFHAFNAFHSLNFSITRFSDIVSQLMKNQQINDNYYQVLNQVNENLVNLQNYLNLAYEIENDCNALIDLDTMLIRRLPIIEQELLKYISNNKE
ncbi:hypothetical protein M9Y10_039302 [Tritrichomonas musculus]|uniref:Uncharacterized protein n=1 Tax=Tritrichomonas musculus TaxID=1915356 RepID=A0ABR2KBG5_9EUKA